MRRLTGEGSRDSAIARIRLKCGEQADELLKKRWHIVNLNIWRPLNGPVKSMPPAVCDSQHLHEDDIVASDIVLPHLQIQAYEVWYNPNQLWYFLENQVSSEVLLMLSADSDTSTLSYAAAAASGPKQTPEEAAAPQPVELVNNESASTASLVDVDMPSVHTVPSDFLDQEVQTQTQADRIDREQDAKRQAEDAKRKAAAKAKKADDWVASYFNALTENQASAVVAANLASVVGVSAFLGYKAWGLYQRGGLNGKSVGLGVGILAGVAAVEAFIGPYLYKAKKSDRS
ncbi:hypothetical protein AK830_g8520 [Neonectria ditissima]|uniref:Mitochondrial outer membrane protein OM14 C-terminal domain-containing protein n=1 Tax=Neonectria ditissima TaxID=78410 RepID=A0A0P7AKE0_9HYPO|nr:hypothetical protein AK830_g8520 [Neonectria ditissima]